MNKMEKEIDKNNLPKHLAIIMDGNGRWAKKQGMLRVFGHEKGTKSVKQTVENCAKLGIEFLTLYAFFNRKLEPTKNRSRHVNEIIS